MQNALYRNECIRRNGRWVPDTNAAFCDAVYLHNILDPSWNEITRKQTNHQTNTVVREHCIIHVFRSYDTGGSRVLPSGSCKGLACTFK